MSYPHTGTDYLISPGEVLEDFFESRDVDLQQFADRCGMPIKMLQLLIDGDRPITSEIAEALGRELNTNPVMWINLQAAYNRGKAEHFEVNRQMAR